MGRSDPEGEEMDLLPFRAQVQGRSLNQGLLPSLLPIHWPCAWPPPRPTGPGNESCFCTILPPAPRRGHAGFPHQRVTVLLHPQRPDWGTQGFSECRMKKTGVQILQT